MMFQHPRPRGCARVLSDVKAPNSIWSAEILRKSFVTAGRFLQPDGGGEMTYAGTKLWRMMANVLRQRVTMLIGPSTRYGQGYSRARLLLRGHMIIRVRVGVQS